MPKKTIIISIVILVLILTALFAGVRIGNNRTGKAMEIRIDNLKEQLKESSGIIDSLTEENKRLGTTISGLESENSRLGNDIAELRKINERLNNIVGEISDSNQEAQGFIGSADQGVSGVIESMQSAIEKAESLEDNGD